MHRVEQPLVTIGLVVRNGETYIAEAIRTFQQQTFHNYDMLVCDNASTDGTANIVSKAARQDARIRFVRHAHNIGAGQNFLFAAEQCTTRYFCWAAHDDLRSTDWLERLVDLLETNSQADLAASHVTFISPSGDVMGPCSATSRIWLRPSLHREQRLRQFLKHAPGSLIYGLFRTLALHETLPVLRDLMQLSAGAVFGGDLIFLAAFLREHSAIIDERAMLYLREGGISHQPNGHHSLSHLGADVVRFATLLRDATRVNHSWLQRAQLALARWRLLWNILSGRPFRRLMEHHLVAACPSIQGVIARWRAAGRAYRRLRRRTKTLPQGSRIVLFGAGKHTRRMLPALAHAVSPHARIVGMCDDNAHRMASFADLPLIPPRDLQALQPQIIIVSSDAYEAALYRRALEIAPAGVPVWCLYDPSIETGGERSELLPLVVRAS